MKTNYKFFSISCLIATICILITRVATSQGWYDPDWKYRNSVIVTNPAGISLTDFQVQISLDNSFDFAKTENDGGDVRLTDIDGITLIPFWIESWNVTEQQATIWVKVPAIPISGTTVYMYYGNPNAVITPPVPVETPPVGPFTRAVGNPINPIDDPGSGASLLAENIVFDNETGHYWMVFANYRGGSPGVGLVWSDNPADATSWHWHGNVYTHTSGGSFAPHIIKENGIWYIFFAKWPDIVYITSSTVNGTYSAPTIVLSPTLTWEAYRVDEPYVFKRNDNKWIMIYMADAGGVTEQVGYAYADEITGPYTKFAENPCLAFGPPGSFDAGTIADPWVYEFNDVYYIGYTVSPTKNSPWQTALATTTDWQTFTKQGVIFPLAGSGWDAVNSFRGAVTRIGDTYVFSYTGDGYRMGIATQPVFMVSGNIINEGDAVFDFFDGFDGSSINLGKWTLANGSQSQTNVANGFLTLNATSDAAYIRILGQKAFEFNYISETHGYHPNQGTVNKIAEVGFCDNSLGNILRIVDDFPSITHWQRQAKITSGPNVLSDMAQTADQNWHVFHVFRQSPDIAGFKIDTNTAETINTNVPAISLPPFLMSYGTSNQFVVDWTRVRKWAGVDPVTYVIGEASPLIAIETHTQILCYGGTSAVTIIGLGGTPPYNGTGTFNQSAGTMMYTITDAIGGTSDVIVTITEPEALTASYSSSEILCYGGNTSVTISATEGTPPYTGTGIFTHNAGSYTHTVTDASGCISVVSIMITEPPALVVTADYTEIPFPGGSSTVTINATGGTSPYTGAGTFTQPAGTVVYTVIDANGCTSNVSITITDPSAWFDLNWNYRRPITIANPGGTALADFQVLISLDNSFDFSKAKMDGSDIRIMDVDKTTPIPFWIESWNVAEQLADIWVKVPAIPTQGTTVYLYYGNPEPTIEPPTPVETPPVGPFTRAVGNPIIPIGDPGYGASLLAENIVYDDATGHYWMVFANYRSGSQGVGLVWSDTPTDATSWHWHGNIYNHSGAGGSFAPHIIKEGSLWYVFFAKWPDIVYMTSQTINGTYSSTTIVLSPSAVWESYRVDEPYVFQRNDGKWIMMYMGDYGSAHEQIGYATADIISGPYTKFAVNPCIPFGAPGSYDAGTVADPWVYLFNGVYYIGYTVSSTTSSPWQTAIATTTDWQTFTRLGIIFPLAGSGWDATNSFRGAMTRIGDTYVFSYVGDSYKMGIATQPVFMPPISNINNGDAVFDFFDGFDGSSFDNSKWSFTHGSSNQASVSGGLLTLTSPSATDYLRISGQKSFGMNYMGETRAYHPNQGTLNMIAEVGFTDPTWNTIRIVDDFALGITYWQKQSKLAGQPDIFTNMAQAADQNWHVFHVFSESSGIAGFQIDKNLAETVNTNVPTMNLPPFLMSYGINNQFVVDWTRVRKWIGTDPEVLIGDEQAMEIFNLKVYLEGAYNGTDMNTHLNDLNILPLIQPYNTPPWNYSGAEEVESIPNNVVDWVLVELRDAQDVALANSSTQVSRQAALLLKDGRIAGLDGISLLQFNIPINQQLYIVIWQRNHLSVLSANALTQNPEGLYIYDFSTSASQAYGEGQNPLGTDIYGMIGGDANADGLINGMDEIQIWTPQAGTTGYFKGDMNLDGQVNNPDKNNVWFENLGKGTHVPE
jgi:hypothetical protein